MIGVLTNFIRLIYIASITITLDATGLCGFKAVPIGGAEDAGQVFDLRGIPRIITHDEILGFVFSWIIYLTSRLFFKTCSTGSCLMGVCLAVVLFDVHQVREEDTAKNTDQAEDARFLW